MKHKNISVPGKFLYEEDGYYFIRKEDEEILKIPVNKFYHGQIVKSSTLHHSVNEFVTLTDPSYSEQYKYWCYGQSYRDMNGRCGGGSYSWKEDEFTELTDVDSKLFAERLYLLDDILNYESALKLAKDKLDKIEYALSISVENYTSIRTKCEKCKTPMSRNKTNCNIDKCDNCYPSPAIDASTLTK